METPLSQEPLAAAGQDEFGDEEEEGGFEDETEPGPHRQHSTSYLDELGESQEDESSEDADVTFAAEPERAAPVLRVQPESNGGMQPGRMISPGIPSGMGAGVVQFSSAHRIIDPDLQLPPDPPRRPVSAFKRFAAFVPEGEALYASPHMGADGTLATAGIPISIPEIPVTPVAPAAVPVVAPVAVHAPAKVRERVRVAKPAVEAEVVEESADAEAPAAESAAGSGPEGDKSRRRPRRRGRGRGRGKGTGAGAPDGAGNGNTPEAVPAAAAAGSDEDPMDSIGNVKPAEESDDDTSGNAVGSAADAARRRRRRGGRGRGRARPAGSPASSSDAG